MISETATGIPNGKLGMWLFLASEVMLFGGFISSYVILRTGSPSFGVPPREMLGVPLATFNTMVLIVSSMTMVMALDSIQRDNLRRWGGYLTATILLGCTFLGVKAFEYHHERAQRKHLIESMCRLAASLATHHSQQTLGSAVKCCSSRTQANAETFW